MHFELPILRSHASFEEALRLMVIHNALTEFAGNYFASCQIELHLI